MTIASEGDIEQIPLGEPLVDLTIPKVVRHYRKLR
jgi:hypothetical protein